MTGLMVILAVCVLAERLPANVTGGRTVPWRTRVASNGALYLLAALAVTFSFATPIEEIAADLTSGLLHGVELPFLLELVAAFLALDLWRYWEHRAFHEIPWLWRLHRVHHSDVHLDASTSQRHHPLESLLVTFLGAMLLFAIGFSAASLLTYAAVAGFVSIINHTRLRLPVCINLGLRKVIATPAVHHLHHSAAQSQTDSNYGSVLTVWDQLWGTWSDPRHVHASRFGLDEFRTPEEHTVLALLTQPFRRGRRDDSREAASASADGQSIDALPGTISRRRRRLSPAAMGFPSREMCLVIALAVAVICLTWTSIIHLFGIWTGADSYRYAFLVLPLFVFLVWGPWRATVLSLPRRAHMEGAAALALAVMGWVLSFQSDFRLGEHLSIVLCFQAIALLAVGPRGFARLWPLLALLFFMVPGGDLLLAPLRELTVAWLAATTPLFADSVVVEGFRIVVNGQGYRVINDCAGLPIVLLGAFLGYGFGLMLYRRFAPALTMGLICAGLAMLSNLLRATAIVWLDAHHGNQMSPQAHADVQLVSVILFLAILLAGLRWIAPTGDGSAVREGDDAQTVPARESSPRA